MSKTTRYRVELQALELPKLQSLIRFTVSALIAGTALVLAVNVNDSTVFKPAILYIFTAVLIVLGVRHVAVQREFRLNLSIIHMGFLAYLLVGVFSLVNAINLRLGIEALAQFSCYFVILMTVAASPQVEINAHLSSTFTIVTSIVCLVGLVQSFITIPSITFLVSAERQTFSTFGNATYFAGFLVLMLPAIGGQAIRKESSTLKKALAIMLFLVMMLLLIRTEARSAWVGIVVGSILFIYIVSGQPGGQHKILLVAFAVGILFIAVFHHTIFGRLSSLFTIDASSSIARRLYFYRGAWNAWLASPIIGNGIGNFVVFLPKFRSPEYWMARAEDIVPHAHNEFLEILSETGILGFACFIAIIVSYLIALKRGLRRDSKNDSLQLCGYASAIIAALVDNMASLNLRTTPVAVLFWVIVGLSINQLPVKSFSISLKLHQAVGKFQWIAPLVVAILLWWYVPRVINRYQAERSFLSGTLARWQNNTDLSTWSFTDALKYDPNFPQARLYIAADLVQAARYKEALEHTKILLHTHPYYPKARIVFAICSFELQDTVEAMKAIDQELSIENSPQALYYASYFAAHSRDTILQYHYLTSLLRQNLRSGIQDYAAEGLQQLELLLTFPSDTAEVLSILSGLRQRFSAGTGVLAEIVECYQQLGRVAEARSTLDAAFEHHSSDQAVIEHLNRLQSSLDPDKHH